MIGYKVAAYKDDSVWKPCLMTLEIPEDSKIVAPIISNSDPLSISKYGNKLRCDKCRVCSITDLETGETVDRGYSLYILSLIVSDNIYFGMKKSHSLIPMWLEKYSFSYAVSNEYDIHPDALNEDITEECTHGIHFFATEEDAKNFYSDPGPSGGRSWASQVIYKANIFYPPKLDTIFLKKSDS